jgi:cytosine deaminase
VITNARLADHPSREPIDIAIADGRIAALGHVFTAAQSHDAAGRLVCAGLIDTHIHLDKSRRLGFQSFWMTEHHFQPEGAEMSPIR